MSGVFQQQQMTTSGLSVIVRARRIATSGEAVVGVIMNPSATRPSEQQTFNKSQPR